jgi:hypothetical protein
MRLRVQYFSTSGNITLRISIAYSGADSSGNGLHSVGQKLKRIHYTTTLMYREKLIDTILGKQLLPAHPIIILSLLQSIDVSRNVSNATGSYGELYEALITERLASVSKKPTDLGTKYTIIARIAYYMYDRESESFTPDDINTVCDRYLRDYQIRIDPARLIEDLTTADIITSSGGSYRFK